MTTASDVFEALANHNEQRDTPPVRGADIAYPRFVVSGESRRTINIYGNYGDSLPYVSQQLRLPLGVSLHSRLWAGFAERRAEGATLSELVRSYDVSKSTISRLSE